MATLSATSTPCPPFTYIYRLLPSFSSTTTLSSLTTLSSDDCLRFHDPTTLSLLPDGVISNVHKSVTCLEPSGANFATAGRDGLVKFWDTRGRGAVGELGARK
jgi:WD40 repeat protein